MNDNEFLENMDFLFRIWSSGIGEVLLDELAARITPEQAQKIDEAIEGNRALMQRMKGLSLTA